MNKQYLHTIRNKLTLVRLVFVIAAVCAIQFQTSQHQIQHLFDYNDTACVQCIVTPNAFTDIAFEVEIFIDSESYNTFFQEIETEGIVSFSFYQSRAPPVLIS